MPGPLVSLCVAVALAAASGDGLPGAHEETALGVDELRQLLDGVPLAGMGAGPHGAARVGPIHPWRLFMERAPHPRRTVEAMLALLDATTEPERRTRLMQALSLERDPRLRPVWNGLITNGKPEDAESWAPFAFEGLLRIGEEEDHRLLMDLLGRDPRIDVWLMRALGRTGSRWASELVLRTYRSEQEYEPLRVAAFDAALALSDDASQLLAEGLSHRARSIRLAALANEGLCGFEPPVPRLLELAEEPDTQIAAEALRLLARGCESEAFRDETVRQLLARPEALAGAPLLVLALAEWADGAGELNAAESLYRRVLPRLVSGSEEHLRALFRLGALLQLTGRTARASELGAMLQRLHGRKGARWTVPRVPGEPSNLLTLQAAARELLTATAPEVMATLAQVPGWRAWRISVRSAGGGPAAIAVHRARLCVRGRCFDALSEAPSSRALEAAEPLCLYAGEPSTAAPEPRGCDGYAVVDVSVDGTWRARVLARCEGSTADLHP